MQKREDAVVLITGATDGLGERVAMDLAAGRGALLLHGRDLEKGRRVLEKIAGATGNGCSTCAKAPAATTSRFWRGGGVTPARRGGRRGPWPPLRAAATSCTVSG